MIKLLCVYYIRFLFKGSRELATELRTKILGCGIISKTIDRPLFIIDINPNKLLRIQMNSIEATYGHVSLNPPAFAQMSNSETLYSSGLLMKFVMHVKLRRYKLMEII